MAGDGALSNQSKEEGTDGVSSKGKGIIDGARKKKRGPDSKFQPGTSTSLANGAHDGRLKVVLKTLVYKPALIYLIGIDVVYVL